MRKLVLSVAALALLATPAFAGKYNAKIDIGQKAPDFSGIEAIDGKGGTTSLSLADLKEDVVVVVFLAKHCPYVTAIEDRLIDFVDTNSGKSVRLVGIAVSGRGTRSQDDLTAIKEQTKTKKFNFAYGFDDSQDVGRAYNATNTPQFFVLDKTRTIRYQGAFDDAPMDETKANKHYVQDAVNALLEGKEIAVTETRQIGCGISYDKR
ncbi:MAG: thioredoxin family protein [Isosphaeraceae bacterium]